MTTPLPDSLCHLNGQTLPLSEAKVSVLDRGFIFGDGIYDVVPVYGCRLFRFDEHMARLERGLHKIRIQNPHTREQWLQRCRRLVEIVAQARGGSMRSNPIDLSDQELEGVLISTLAG